jgi:tRNA/tmRNA/rRNA uracil-C5-methylase (TrmA/RlmC/RlmD family)
VLRRHALAFFQGNRFLLADLVWHVVDQIPRGSAVVDLYAGGGLFAIAAARFCGASVNAVEGDRFAAEDLLANAASTGGAVTATRSAVERYTMTASPDADVVVVDPPRTGMSREAVMGVVRLSGRRIVYVSCDVATLARDARRLVDAGYQILRIDAFDLFPNTPHVETVVVFERP